MQVSCYLRLLLEIESVFHQPNLPAFSEIIGSLKKQQRELLECQKLLLHKAPARQALGKRCERMMTSQLGLCFSKL
jgi:hypothetical protein